MTGIKKIPNEYAFRNHLVIGMNNRSREAWSNAAIDSICELRSKLGPFSPCDKWDVIMYLDFLAILKATHLIGSEWKTTFAPSDRKGPDVTCTIGTIIEETMESAFLDDKSNAVLPFSIKPLMSKDAKETGLNRWKAQVINVRVCTTDYDWQNIPVGYIVFDTEECSIVKEKPNQRETGGRITGYHILKLDMTEADDITIGELLDIARCRTATLARLQMKETIAHINQLASQNFIETQDIASMQTAAENIYEQAEKLRDSIVQLIGAEL